MDIMMKKNFLKRTALAGVLIILILTSGMLTACTTNNSGNRTGQQANEDPEVGQVLNENSTAAQGDNGDKIMEDYIKLLEDDASLDEVIKFIDENISMVSSENASKMVDDLEEMQKKSLPQVEDKFFKEENLQKEMVDLYLAGSDINDVDNIKDEKLQELLRETLNRGYKVETAEGMFFPVINYEFHKKYSDYVSTDMKGYIDLMAVESNEVPAKDAALVISWDELVKRALNQEKFIEVHKSSQKAEEIEKLYGRYLTYTLLGLNNTPLFDYESNVMDEEAKRAYMSAIDGSSDSQYLKTLKDFMDMLKKANYKLTDEIDAYRKGILKKFQ